MVINQGLQQPERIKPPRVLFLKFPYGQPFGQANDTDQQTVLVKDALRLLETVREPGEIVRAPYRWRREDFSEIRRERASRAD